MATPLPGLQLKVRMIREFVVDKTLPLSEHVSVESAAPLVGQAWVQDH